jgi:hypothetical protein
MAYTGVDFLADLRKQVSQYTTEFVSTAWGNYLAKQSLFELIERNYAGIINQYRKDEISSLIKTNQVYPVINNSTPLKVFAYPEFYLNVGPPNVYQIDFTAPHNLGSGASVVIAGVLVATNANGTFTYVTSLSGAGQYIVVNPTRIWIQVTGAAVTGSSGGTLAGTNYITDYYHLLAVKTTFQDPTPYSITGASFTSPIVITVRNVNNIRNGEKVIISGVGGNTGANGTFYAQRQLAKTFALYTDQNLTVASTPAGSLYTSGGTITRVHEYYAKTYNSDQQIDLFGATPQFPQVGTTEWTLKYYPSDKTCSSISIDYIKKAALISTTDAVTDLSQFYNQSFLNDLVEYSAKAFFTIVQSPEDFQLIQANIAQENAAR